MDTFDIKTLYTLAEQWTQERLKDSDPCWRTVINSDAMVVYKFLKYVWMLEGEEKNPA
jgi:hypothetical protein